MAVDRTARSQDVWDYHSFVPGQSLDSTTLSVDERRLRLWSGVFGPRPHGQGASRSILVSAMMEGFIKAAQPRPPGNIHAAQKLWLSSRRLEPGSSLEISTMCKEKFERKDRKWVRFETLVQSDGELLLRGEILTIWAR